MVFLRRICSSRPGDGEQRRQSLAALTAHGRGLDCLQPQPRQPVLRRNKLRIFRFRASTKAQPLRFFLLSPRSRLLRGAPFMAGHCVSKQVGRHDAACQGCPRCVSRSPEARCLRVFARAVRFSQPAVLSALLVIQLFGIVIPPPYFLLRAPKGALRPFSVAALLHYFSWCASEYFVVGRISHRSSMITPEQTFFNDASEYLFPR